MDNFRRHSSLDHITVTKILNVSVQPDVVNEETDVRYLIFGTADILQ